VALVTDAMAATGVGDGHYRLGVVDVEVRATRPLVGLRGPTALAVHGHALGER